MDPLAFSLRYDNLSSVLILNKALPGAWSSEVFRTRFTTPMEEKCCCITGIPAVTVLSSLPTCIWSKEHRSDALKFVMLICRPETFHSMRFSSFS